MRFLDIAMAMAARGVPITPVRPNTKKAFLPLLPNDEYPASTDVNQIQQWNLLYADHNAACVATGKPDGFWFFEVDSPSVLDRIKTETGHDLVEEVKTFLVRSRPGRGHFYFRNTQAALAMGNISQTYVRYGDWSARVKNQYVVAAGSINPHSNEPYAALFPDNQINEAPQWLIDWCLAQRVEKRPAQDGDIPKDERGLIPHGFIHGYMLRQAGRLREMGLEPDEIEHVLLNLVHKNCAPPIDDVKVRAMAHSSERWEAGTPTFDIVFNQKPMVEAALALLPEEEIPQFEAEKYPEFPSWVMSGTSVFRNFVEPVCQHNSRIPYFMWLPAEALLMNYIGTKIKLKGPFGSSSFNGSMYMVLTGKRGETNKSSSVDDAFNYFHYAGVLSHASRDIKNAEGRSLVWTAGSAEGLGIEMQKTNCKNVVLYYDELLQLVKKAGIDGSTMNSNLLTMYESKKYENTVKHSKEKYSIDPGTYCASLIACCTDTSFDELWSKMAANDTGLNDRFFFIMQPETLPEKRLKVDVNTIESSQETRKLIDKAIAQGSFEIENTLNSNLQSLVSRGNRYVERAIKWAVAIAVDLGLSIVDDECIDRGVAIVEYEMAVKIYQKSYEAVTREGELQLRIRSKLESSGGSLPSRKLMQVCHAERYGTTAWNQAFYGLQKNGIIREIGTGKLGDPKITQVLIKRDIEEV